MPDDIKNHAIGPKGYRNCNLRQRFIRLIKRAGVKPWPKPFNNLREGRQGAPGGAIEDGVSSRDTPYSPYGSAKTYPP